VKHKDMGHIPSILNSLLNDVVYICLCTYNAYIVWMRFLGVESDMLTNEESTGKEKC